MSELNNTLDHLGWFQMLLAMAFVSSYAMALTPFAGARGQGRSALAAVASGSGFTALTDPWVHGVLLVMLAIAGMALFVGTAWLLSRLAAGSAPRVASVMPAPPVEASADRRVKTPLHGGAASGVH